MASGKQKLPLWSGIVMAVLAVLVVLLGFAAFNFSQEMDSLKQGNDQLQEIVFDLEAEATGLKETLAKQEAEGGSPQGKAGTTDSTPGTGPSAAPAPAGTPASAEVPDAVREELARLKQRVSQLIAQNAALASSPGAAFSASGSEPGEDDAQKVIALTEELERLREMEERARRGFREANARAVGAKSEALRDRGAFTSYISALERQLDALSAASDSNETLKAEVARLNTALASALEKPSSRAPAAATPDAEALRAALAGAEKDRDAVMAWARKLEDQVASLTEQEDNDHELRAKVDGLQGETRRLRAALKEARMTASSGTEGQAALEAKLKDAERDREVLMKSVAKLEEKAAAMAAPAMAAPSMASQAALEAKLKDAERDREALMKWVAKLEERAAATPAPAMAAPSMASQAALEAKLKDAERDREALMKWVAKLEERIAAMPAPATAAPSMASQAALEAKLKDAERDREALMKWVAKLEERAAAPHPDAASSTARAAELTQQADAVRQDRDILLARLNELKDKLESVKKVAAPRRPRPVATAPARAAASGAAEAVASGLAGELSSRGLRGIDVTAEADGSVVLKLRNRLLFGAGSAGISSAGASLLTGVGKLLGEYPGYDILVEGHTDNVPVTRGQAYRSNWELSSVRASNATRMLAESGGIEEGRLAAVGYADTRPVASNVDEEGRRLNRRIEIRLQPAG